MRVLQIMRQPVVAAALFRIGRIDDEWLVRTPLDLGYIALSAVWGAAALTPPLAMYRRSDGNHHLASH